MHHSNIYLLIILKINSHSRPRNSRGTCVLDYRHAFSSTCSKVIYRVSVSVHTGSPNSLPTHWQTHKSHVQWSLEALSCVSLCVHMCVVQYLHHDGWKPTVRQNHRRPVFKTVGTFDRHRSETLEIQLKKFTWQKIQHTPWTHIDLLCKTIEKQCSDSQLLSVQWW